MRQTIFCRSLDDINRADENRANIVCNYPFITDWICVVCEREQDADTPRFFPAYESKCLSYGQHCPHCAEGVT